MELHASVASFRAREQHLPTMVASILPQVDRLHVYLNDYEVTPPALLLDPKVEVVHGRDAIGDIGDVGKFYFQEQYRDRDVLWFTCDDDLLYPHNYVAVMRSVSSFLINDVVSFHGSLLSVPADTYRNSRTTFNCLRQVRDNARVHVIGTGCAAFHLGTIVPTVNDFPVPNMADIWFAKLLQEHEIPARVLAHRAGWLQLLTSSKDDSLWNRGELPESMDVVRRTHWRLF